MKCQNIKMKWIILFWICSCVTEIEGGPLNQVDETGTNFVYLSLCLIIHYIHIKGSFADLQNV